MAGAGMAWTPMREGATVRAGVDGADPDCAAYEPVSSYLAEGHSKLS